LIPFRTRRRLRRRRRSGLHIALIWHLPFPFQFVQQHYCFVAVVFGPLAAPGPLLIGPSQRHSRTESQFCSQKALQVAAAAACAPSLNGPALKQTRGSRRVCYLVGGAMSQASADMPLAAATPGSIGKALSAARHARPPLLPSAHTPSADFGSDFLNGLLGPGVGRNMQRSLK
jgi:hypothetical protein